MSTKATLLRHIDAYLKNHKKSDGGWAPVDPPEVGELSDIVSRLIALKYQRDPDGDLPIRFDITDVTRYERPFHIPVQRTHRAVDGQSEVDLHLKAAASYSTMAKWSTESANKNMEMARMLLQETTSKNRALELNGVRYLADAKGVTAAQAQAALDSEFIKALKKSPLPPEHADRHTYGASVAESASKRLGIKVLSSSCSATAGGARAFFFVPALDLTVKVLATTTPPAVPLAAT